MATHQSSSMHELRVKSLPFKEVIRDIANELEAVHQEDCEVYFVKIPSKWGEGTIRGINFPMGIGLIYYSCIFNEDIAIKFDVSEIHPAKFLYCKEGFLRHCFLDMGEIHDLDQYQSAIVSSEGLTGHQIQFKGGVKTEIGSLEIDRGEFKKHFSCDLESMNASLQSLFEDVNATTKFYQGGDYSAKLNDIMNQIAHDSGTGFVRRMYLQGKSLEILAEQIRQYSDDTRGEEGQNLLRQAELSKIAMLAEDMRNHPADDHSIRALTEKTGLNENKLQAGFKLLYKTTIKGYLQDERMTKARDLLVNTDYNVSEIMHLIGLNNGGYFSKVFREKYGMNPSEYRAMSDNSNSRRNSSSEQ